MIPGNGFGYGGCRGAERHLMQKLYSSANGKAGSEVYGNCRKRRLLWIAESGLSLFLGTLTAEILPAPGNG